MTANAAGERFGYDGESHQTEFFNANNSGSTPDAVYTYDGEGRRVKKVSATETTIFVYDASGVLIAEYSGEVAAEPRISYLTTDHLGSPRVTTDERGVVVNRRDFMAFGEEAVSVQRVGDSSGNGYNAAGSTRKDYTGYEKDIGDPTWTRTRDPMVKSHLLYRLSYRTTRPAGRPHFPHRLDLWPN